MGHAGLMPEDSPQAFGNLQTERYTIRPLTVDDATVRYLSWFTDDGAAHIQTAGSVHECDDLRAYIADKSGRNDVLFLGIFDRASGLHIGNLKYEPVDSQQGYAMLGIFVGDPASRNKGVAAEVIRASADWLKEHRGVHEIILGVATSNVAAIKAYEKIGFMREASPHYPHATASVQSMVWKI